MRIPAVVTEVPDWTEEEWREWISLTPQQRWEHTEKLWKIYLANGGSLDPEPDPQSPFWFPDDDTNTDAAMQADIPIIRHGLA